MIRYGLFRFGSLAYAVPLLRMCKILHLQTGHRLPRLPVGVAEILIDDGRLVPVLRLPIAPGAEPDGPSVREAEYKVLVESEAGAVAFSAEVTCGIVAEQKGKLLDPDGEQISEVIGIFKYQGKEFKILDIDLLAIGMTQKV
jgi:chemotaxis signal transduction protein